MTELSPRHHEQTPERAETREISAEQHRPKSGESATEPDRLAESLEALQKRADTHALSGKDTRFDRATEHSNTAPGAFSLGMHQQLKNDSYKRTLNKVRSHLSASDRILSRAIHQPAVEAISEVAAKTIGRPYALLFASTTTLLGTALVLYFAKYSGFRYNYTIFFVLFIGGFLVGLLAELVTKLPVFRKKDRY